MCDEYERLMGSRSTTRHTVLLTFAVGRFFCYKIKKLKTIKKVFEREKMEMFSI